MCARACVRVLICVSFFIFFSCGFVCVCVCVCVVVVVGGYRCRYRLFNFTCVPGGTPSTTCATSTGDDDGDDGDDGDGNGAREVGRCTESQLKTRYGITNTNQSVW